MRNLVKLVLAIYILGIFNISGVYASNFEEIKKQESLKKGAYSFSFENTNGKDSLKIKKEGKNLGSIANVITAISDGKTLYYAKKINTKAEFYLRNLSNKKDKKIGTIIDKKMQDISIKGTDGKKLYMVIDVKSNSEIMPYASNLHCMDIANGKNKILRKDVDRVIYTPKNIFFVNSSADFGPKELFAIDLNGKNLKSIGKDVIYYKLIQDEIYYAKTEDSEISIFSISTDTNKKKSIMKNLPIEKSNIMFITDITKDYVKYSMTDKNDMTFEYKLDFLTKTVEKIDEI